jgi:hypothetical protein
MFAVNAERLVSTRTEFEAVPTELATKIMLSLANSSICTAYSDSAIPTETLSTRV